MRVDPGQNTSQFEMTSSVTSYDYGRVLTREQVDACECEFCRWCVGVRETELWRPDLLACVVARDSFFGLKIFWFFQSRATGSNGSVVFVKLSLDLHESEGVYRDLRRL